MRLVPRRCRLTIFPDLTDYRIVLAADDQAEATATIAAIFSMAGVALTFAGVAEAAVRLIRRHRPNLVLVATAIAGGPFAVVETARHGGVPVLALDLGSAGPEVSDRLRREYGIAVLRDIDEPEALCHAAKRAADEAVLTNRREAVAEMSRSIVDAIPRVTDDRERLRRLVEGCRVEVEHSKRRTLALMKIVQMSRTTTRGARHSTP